MKWLDSIHDMSFGRKLSLSILGTSAAAVVIITLLILIFTLITERREIQDELKVMARMVGDNSSAALVFGDHLAARETLFALKARESVEMACLYIVEGEQTRLFADYYRLNRQCPEQVETSPSYTGLVVTVPIELRGNVIGYLQLQENYQALWDVSLLYTLAISLSLLIALILAWVLSIQFKSWLSAPVIDLTQTANRIAETGDYSLRVTDYGDDEVGQLIRRFNEMLMRIEAQNDELLESRNHLEERVADRTARIAQAMHQLEDAQKQLIQTEKLAALGSLVAGVAHEINTPVGVGMTASSSLNDLSRDVQEKLQAGTLTKGAFEDYLRDALEASDIILKNLGRAAELVRSFKQVAIDQSGLERRKIGFADYIQSVLTSLHPALRKGGHAVEIDCDEELCIDTYPGALSQILTNLVMNSITHGYDEGQQGHIRIRVLQEGADIRLIYLDDGKGMSAEYLAHAFEPFVTSRRGQGGSGLGLHIVHNIVTQTLNGRISLISTPGKGVRFEILMPVELVDTARKQMLG